MLFTYREFPEIGPSVANIFMECEFDSGATAHLNSQPVTGVLIERATVTRLHETYFLKMPIWAAYDAPGRLTRVVRVEVVEDIGGDEICAADQMFVGSGFHGENEAFLDDLRAGRRPVGDVASGLQSVEIADCIRGRVHSYETRLPRKQE